MTDTIAAIATPPGVGGVGIIRISGPSAKQLGINLTSKNLSHQKATYSSFLDEAGQAIDFGYVLFFQGPHSFTGEDVVEVQGHGGPVVMDMVLRRILQLGARLAEPGEFSKQAFLNDKIDLIQAEAIADLIESSSESSVRLAQRALTGAFSHDIQDLSVSIIQLRMYIEAALDFPEEEIDFISDGKVADKLVEINSKLNSILSKASQGAMVREGLQLVIVGQPNVGKSTIINQLSGQETSIVTEIAGTTRDIIREKILIEDIPIHVVDTAGIRAQTEDKVEAEGIKRAKSALKTADLVLFVTDIEHASEKHIGDFIKDNDIVGPYLVVVNKIDLNAMPAKNDNGKVYISAKSGNGMTLLKKQILKCAGVQQKESQGAYLARRRHLDALERALKLVQTGQHKLKEHNAGELLAEDLKYAHQSLCEITGEFTADDLLGKIFSSFCIGK